MASGPGELPVLRALPDTAVIFRCKARVAVLESGVIEGLQWTKPAAAHTVFFTYTDPEDAELTSSERNGLISPRNEVIGYVHHPKVERSVYFGVYDTVPREE